MRLPVKTHESTSPRVGSLATDTSEPSDALFGCDEVAHRARQTLEWARTSNAEFLSTALEHLTLARALLYWALLNRTEAETLRQAVDTALSKLRQANQLTELPKAILTSAFYSATLGGQPEDAKGYLDEAQLIAERGPMPLHLADVHLHRARLFGALARRGQFDYPWESLEHDLKEARRLIEKHGYWRRKEELEDAEAAFGRG